MGFRFGALIALIALGYTMVYGIIGLINFAHGDLFMLGAFLAWTLVGWLKLEDAGTAGDGRRDCPVARCRADVLRGIELDGRSAGLQAAPQCAEARAAGLGDRRLVCVHEHRRVLGGESDRDFPSLVSTQKPARATIPSSIFPAKACCLIAVVVPIMIGLDVSGQAHPARPRDAGHGPKRDGRAIDGHQRRSGDRRHVSHRRRAGRSRQRHLWAVYPQRQLPDGL